MLRILMLTSLLLISNVSLAAPLYQVDLIIFTHQQPSSKQDSTWPPILKPNTQHAIPLQANDSTGGAAYHLRPSSSSQLKNEYWALSHKPNYHVLAHYTWLQPSHSQRPIALSIQSNNDWRVEGTLRIRQSNYYLLDTELLFSAPNNRQIAFMFSQKQRLKPGTVYYLDHPQAGLLIKVHQVT